MTISDIIFIIMTAPIVLLLLYAIYKLLTDKNLWKD